YDITDWVPNHPGGEVILRAVGGNIEPYWNIFTIHKKQEVYDILEQYLIGKVDPRDLVEGKAPNDEVDDPFKKDPERSDALIVRSSRPCNAETPKDQLETFITPSDQHYVRNHLWVPPLQDAESHRLTIELNDGTEKEYSVRDLRNNFQHHTITATLQCSGNRRAHMSAEAQATSGLQWDVGAISNTEWTGVRLRDVLQDAGLQVDELPEDVKHIQFMGAEAYGASVPAIKALDRYGDVLLVFEMNGEPLMPDHGYPLRLLCPGHVAARSVKWLQKIAVSEDESWSQWQRRDYKCFGPNQRSDVDWDRAPSIQETPVQSAITSISTITQNRLANSKLAQVYGLEEDVVRVAGYAVSGGGRDIIRVDVSPDNGRTWQQARLIKDECKGSKSCTVTTTMAPRVHLVRHAEGHHQLEPTSKNELIHDPSLTDNGVKNCRQFRSIFPDYVHLDLICASPMRRAIQTAKYCFKSQLEEVGPLLLLPLAQEITDLRSDTGSSPEALVKEFGVVINTSMVEEGWNSKTGIYAFTYEAVRERARDLREWLKQRPEKDLAIVGHGAFWHYLTGDVDELGNQKGPYWNNVEWRSYHFSENGGADLKED
ncbi:phosphoglycerate mutase-like protein, partial [Aureobasidium melanogenum]